MEIAYENLQSLGYVYIYMYNQIVNHSNHFVSKTMVKIHVYLDLKSNVIQMRGTAPHLLIEVPIAWINSKKP